MPDQETKKCKACGVEKPLKDFYRAGPYWQSCCKACDNARRTGRTKRAKKVEAPGQDSELVPFNEVFGGALARIFEANHAKP